MPNRRQLDTVTQITAPLVVIAATVLATVGVVDGGAVLGVYGTVLGYVFGRVAPRPDDTGQGQR